MFKIRPVKPNLKCTISREYVTNDVKEWLCCPLRIQHRAKFSAVPSPITLCQPYMSFLRNAYPQELGHRAQEEYERIGDSDLEVNHRSGRRRRTRCQTSLIFCFSCTKRRLFFILICIPLLVLGGVMVSGVPPDYEDIRAYERHLPQHNTTHEGGMYLRFPDHLWGHGLNNILQE